MKLILASGSPRRQRILGEMGLNFDILRCDVQEVHIVDSPRQTVRKNARLKLDWAQERHPDCAIISADTVVSSGGQCLGKPISREQAAQWYQSFAGWPQQIYTGVGLYHPSTGSTIHLDESTLHFKHWSMEDQQFYLDHVDPLDKAGGYDISEHPERFVQKIEGSETNIMGLSKDTIQAWLSTITL